MADDGSVEAIIQVADGTPEPDDDEQSVYVNITEWHPYQFNGTVKARPADVSNARNALTRVAAMQNIRQSLRAGRVLDASR